MQEALNKTNQTFTIFKKNIERVNELFRFDNKFNKQRMKIILWCREVKRAIALF